MPTASLEEPEDIERVLRKLKMQRRNIRAWWTNYFTEPQIRVGSPQWGKRPASAERATTQKGRVEEWFRRRAADGG